MSSLVATVQITAIATAAVLVSICVLSAIRGCLRPSRSRCIARVPRPTRQRGAAAAVSRGQFRTPALHRQSP